MRGNIAIILTIAIMFGVAVLVRRKIRGNGPSRLDALLTIINAKEAFGVSPGTTYAKSIGTNGREAFGVSPGTLTQLAANHVPIPEDIPMLRQWIADRKQGIYQMTESDLVAHAPIEYSILGNRIGAFA